MNETKLLLSHLNVSKRYLVVGTIFNRKTKLTALRRKLSAHSLSAFMSSKAIRNQKVERKMTLFHDTRSSDKFISTQPLVTTMLTGQTVATRYSPSSNVIACRRNSRFTPDSLTTKITLHANRTLVSQFN